MVDDSADVLETLKMLLEMEDAQVTAFDRPATALDAAKSSRFDFIISDLGMPVMNGHELMSALRQLPHHFRSMNGLWSKAQRLLTFQCRSSAQMIVVLALSCGQNKTPVRVSKQGFRNLILTMTYSHMGKPHTTIGDASFHC